MKLVLSGYYHTTASRHIGAVSNSSGLLSFRENQPDVSRGAAVTPQ